ncbi:hypothetical protein BpHYR1_046452 [Brachionus plicatilis]|uniref:Uncharacterized protein n=1 Tax=Brachionus plicatilis TaxID=10195 RepID=A0A3M7RHB1_BRAPC|nr:hypothetical protein BpHYR1_046452 [Brachionus plicatilis]
MSEYYCGLLFNSFESKLIIEMEGLLSYNKALLVSFFLYFLNYFSQKLQFFCCNGYFIPFVKCYQNLCFFQLNKIIKIKYNLIFQLVHIINRLFKALTFDLELKIFVFPSFFSLRILIFNLSLSLIKISVVVASVLESESKSESKIFFKDLFKVLY